MPLCEAAHYLVSLALQGNNSGETNKKVLAVETAHNIAVGQGDGGPTDQSAGSPFV